MAVILKSNLAARKTIGNIHGWTGPQDYVAMLDFNQGRYFTIVDGQRTDLTPEQAFTLTRSSLGTYTDVTGTLRTASANQPRMQYLEEYGLTGVAVDQAMTNLAPNGSDGAAISVPAASTSMRVFVTFDATTGDAGVTAPELTLEKQWTLPNGRIVKSFTRSVSTAFTAALEVTGDASDITVTSGSVNPRCFIPYESTRAVERLTLGESVKALLSGGDGAVIARAIYYPIPLAQSRAGNMIAVKSGVGQGGLYARVSSSTTVNGTDGGFSAADGAGLNGATNRTGNIIGSWRDQHIKGLTWAGFGDSLGMMSYGQYAYATDIGVTISGIDDIYIGGDAGSVSSTSLLGGIITHVIVYDRMLSVDEALLAANVGWF